MEENNGIFKAMAAVMADCGAVLKERTQGAGFKYRGIDDVYNMMHPVMAKHGVFTTTEIIGEIRSEERTAKSGGAIFVKQATVKFTFHYTDGSSVSSVVVGEAMDSGDKAISKALAIAHKYCLLQAFCLPTEDEKDPDAQTHTPDAKEAPKAPNGTKAKNAGKTPEEHRAELLTSIGKAKAIMGKVAENLIADMEKILGPITSLENNQIEEILVELRKVKKETKKEVK